MRRGRSIPRGLGRAAGRMLVASPVSRAGYLFAHGIGWAWGAALSTGAIRRHEGLTVFTGMPRWSYRRGGMCVGGCYLTGDNVSDAVLAHERVHRAQWLRYGMAFPLLNALAGRDPLHNRFEIEAGLEDGGYL